MGDFAKIASQIHQNTTINKTKHQKIIKFFLSAIKILICQAVILYNVGFVNAPLSKHPP